MDSWYCSNELLEEISKCGFVVILEGKSNVERLVYERLVYVFFLGDERFNVSGLAEEIRWRDSNQRNMRYARVNVTNPTFGEVTIVLFEDKGKAKAGEVSGNEAQRYLFGAYHSCA